MSQGIPGADSTDQVTRGLIEEATQLIGATPQFWGRYFCSPSNPSPYEYTHVNENRPLSENNIKLLPIAEQTWRVAGSQQDGAADAQGNVDDLIETFGADYLAGIGTGVSDVSGRRGQPSFESVAVACLLHGLGANSLLL